MGGRKKTKVFPLFAEITKPNSKSTLKMRCKFCNHEVAKNGTRMEAHIRVCNKITDDIKYKYIEPPRKVMAKIGCKSYKGRILEGQQTPQLESSDSDDIGMDVADALHPSTSRTSTVPVSPTAAVVQKNKSAGHSDPLSKLDLGVNLTSMGDGKAEVVDRSSQQETPTQLAPIFSLSESALKTTSTPKKVSKLTRVTSKNCSFTLATSFADKVSTSQNVSSYVIETKNKISMH